MMQRVVMRRVKVSMVASLPVLLMVTLWVVHWRQMHPPATAQDMEIERLLRQADRLEIVALIPTHETGIWVCPGVFPQSDIQSLCGNFRIASRSSDASNIIFPSIYFQFMRGKQEVVVCNMRDANGRASLHSYATLPHRTNLQLPLHWATARQFDEFITSHRELEDELSKACYD